MDYGAILTYPDGTPFYIDGTMPLSLISIQDKIFSNNETFLDLRTKSNELYVYFVRMEAEDATAYIQVNPDTGNRTITAKRPTNSTYSFSARIYCFGIQYPTPPAWGVAIYNANGKCVLTNETNTLKGLGRTSASGSAGQASFLNESIAGRVAVTPGITGQETYRIATGPASWITAGVIYATTCYYNESTGKTIIRSLTTIPYPGGNLVNGGGNNFRPYYIDCSLYD